ncbi:hypothetical protein [Polymorphospora rubra]|nr:hypothetical protein [Polymorphospora rubra]
MDIEPYDVIDGEIVDNTCESCDQPGTLMIDPYMEDVYGETIMVVLCPEHEQARVDDI